LHFFSKLPPVHHLNLGILSSIIFPVYNWVGLQIKGGLIEQDDLCTLEVDLAKRFCHEAQIQAFHYARSLASLAEMLGRTGQYSEAFECFDIMKAVYMKDNHPTLLSKAYMVDRCALAFTTSALWELKEGRKEKAIERCNYVIENILPSYEERSHWIVYNGDDHC
jgi:tetratricopeptide (TPR) repeat protein